MDGLLFFFFFFSSPKLILKRNKYLAPKARIIALVDQTANNY